MANKEFEIKENVLIKYNEQEGKKEVVIPDGITYIDKFVFYGCQNLSNVILPDSVEDTGYGIFQDSSLKSITLSKKLKSINDGVFSNCENLNSIDIPDSVIEIGDLAFCGCTNLESITFGKNLQKVSKDSFCDCSKIKIVNVPSYKVFKVVKGLPPNIHIVALNTVIKNKKNFSEEDMVEFKKYIREVRIVILNCILYLNMDLTDLLYFMLNDMDKIYTKEEIDKMLKEIIEQGKSREKVEIVAMLIEYKNKNNLFANPLDDDLGELDDEDDIKRL